MGCIMSARPSARTWKSAALAAVVAAGIALTASAAQAEMLDFSLVISNGESGTWTLPSSPVPDYYFSDGAEFSDVFTGVFADQSEVEFRTSSNKGGLIVGTLGFGGAQIFGGTTESPTFAPGVFDLTGTSRTASGETAVLTITAVPEPTTWTLMIVGIGGLGAALRATRKSRLVAQTA